MSFEKKSNEGLVVVTTLVGDSVVELHCGKARMRGEQLMGSPARRR